MKNIDKNEKNKEKSIKMNLLFYLLKLTVTLVFPLITFPYASRVLLSTGIGKINFVDSIIAYFILLASLGINTYAIREAAKYRDNKIELNKFCQEIFIINVFSTVFSYIILALCIFLIPKFHEYRTLLLIYGLTIGFTTLGIEWLYGALEDYKYISIRSFIFNLISLVLVFTLVKTPDDYVKYALIQCFSLVGSNVLNFIHSRKYFSFKKSGKYNFKRHIKPILTIFGLSIACNIYMSFDKTCLGIISGDKSVGLYTAAIKINRIVLSLITALGTVLIPRMSYYIEKKKIKEVHALIVKSANFIMMFAFPSAVGLFLLSGPIINILSGESYAAASITMKILTAIIPIIGMSNLIAVQIFIPFSREKYTLISSSVAAVVNLCLNLLLIPKFAENGAAIGTVIAEFAALVTCYILSRKIINLKGICKNLYQYLIGTGIIIVIYLLLNCLISSQIILMIVTIGISIIAYLTFLLYCKNEYVLEFYQQLKNKLFKSKEKDV